MQSVFYENNRNAYMDKLQPGELAIFFSGEAIRRSCDEYYEFFASRNFIYLTGIEQKESVLVMQKDESGHTEKLFILEPDFLKERWEGARIKADEAGRLSGVKEIRYTKEFNGYIKELLKSKNVTSVYLDIDRLEGQLLKSSADKMEEIIHKEFPSVKINNSLPIMKGLRIIKSKCEIEAMERAQKITTKGILAMMRNSRPGMYEYQYKAEYDYVLAQEGVLKAPFTIISSGKNNFCIHYDSFMGQSSDGDMILNDVGVRWDYEITDVSRGWPCNGKFSDRQKLLYECAYRTSEYMFQKLKPGIPMEDVDATIRRYNYEQLKQAGICDSYEDIGTYMWHGGAHHVGFDTHDLVDSKGTVLTPGMVFCIDVGIYHEEWGIGFRLEDNCLITNDGCLNLSKDTPRTVDEIEGVMM
jgi:Xaa-Pro aminopeptidase